MKKLLIIAVIALSTTFQSHGSAASDQKTKSQIDALCSAATGSNSDAVKKLIASKFNVDERCSDGSIALVCAAESNKPQIVQLLIDTKADVHARDQTEGCTPLQLAALNDPTGASVSMLLNAEADPTITDYSENNALHFAVSTDPTNIVLLLRSLRKRSQTDFNEALNQVSENTFDMDTQTPYSLAELENEHCMELLARAKADVRPPEEIQLDYRQVLSSSSDEGSEYESSEDDPLSPPSKRNKK